MCYISNRDKKQTNNQTEEQTIMSNKKFYGIRYYGGNRTCTTGTPNKKTGRMSIAAEIEVFRSVADRNYWLDDEKLSAPCGCGGGERIAATKKMCRDASLGLNPEEFADWLEIQEENRY